jgi:hypothetical protein
MGQNYRQNNDSLVSLPDRYRISVTPGRTARRVGPMCQTTDAGHSQTGPPPVRPRVRPLIVQCTMPYYLNVNRNRSCGSSTKCGAAGSVPAADPLGVSQRVCIRERMRGCTRGVHLPSVHISPV